MLLDNGFDLNVPSHKVEELRNSFLKEIESKGNDFVHPTDLEKVKCSDMWLKRFLMHTDLDHKLALEMLMETVKWRKDFGVNDINESNIRMEYIVEGGVFPRGRDKDGRMIFVFHCKKHVKGVKNMDDLKRCVVYWFERLERQEKGSPITVFFDMEGCGLSNMDLEFTKYLIGLFKQYYPYFLNYIIIYEMAWILNAAFKIIKAMLPPKAVEKIKMIKKPEVKNWVPLQYAQKSWGGEDDYVFSFVPEVSEVPNNVQQNNNKKVHFADGSPMSETPGAAGDKENDTSNKLLSVTPSTVITFVKDGTELVSTLELQNIDGNTNISYKMKTTSPEKFRVRPSAGCLAPGAKATISVTLLQGFQLGGLSRDKFLVMSIPVDSTDLSPQDLIELWKNVSNKTVTQHRLRCAQSEEVTRNGSAFALGGSQEGDDRMKQLSSNMSQLMDKQMQLQSVVEHTRLLLRITLGALLIFAVVLVYVVRSETRDISSSLSCLSQSAP